MNKGLFYFAALITFLTIQKTGAQVNLQNSLQACYPMDCALNGIVVNGAATGAALNGTVVGNVTCTTGHAGLPNTAMQFGGTISDFIMLPASPLIKPTTSLTIVGWFYFPSNDHENVIFTKNNCGSFFNMNNLIWDAGYLWLVKRPGSADFCNQGVILYTSNSTPYPLNTWHHVVMYVDNSSLEIIVNNGPASVLTHTVPFDYDPVKEVILGGTNEIAANTPFSGKLDNIRFYDRKLTAAEITALYTQYPACTPAPPPIPAFANAAQVCVGSLVTFTNQSAGATSYTWSMPGANPAVSNNTNVSVTYSTQGVYTVNLNASNSSGAVSAVTHTLQVTVCNGIPDHQSGGGNTIYPNPVSGELFLKNLMPLSVKLYNLSGHPHEVPMREMGSGGLALDLHRLAEGLYFLEAETTEGQIVREKIVVVK